MSLASEVYVERRFQRSIRIDSDMQDKDALSGFICPQSSADVLIRMAEHISNGQTAFTWTGPYGCGKSSLVIALSHLISNDQNTRKEAALAVGQPAAEAVWKALPVGMGQWQILPVVGQRASVHSVIGDSLIEEGFVNSVPSTGWTDKSLIKTLTTLAKKSGLVIFIDEMGKFLEAAARRGEDLYFFQLLAEAATRSDGRLVVVGILHQSFEEYASRLSRDARDEWSKIQGRFADLAVNTAGEEQIDLLSRAIHSKHKGVRASAAALSTAGVMKENKPGVGDDIAQLLEDTWPLHPVVAALLGPISRRRFGQNQRSLFGFLNSAEPEGFQDYLRASAEPAERYSPARLWDYLRINLEPTIIASPDGHRWAMAAEVVDRCEAQTNSSAHVDLLKTIAVIDLFRERSGLYATSKLLRESLNVPKKRVDEALADLKSWSFIIYRKHTRAYAIFAGSDFDVEKATEKAREEVSDVDFQLLQQMAGLQPVLAKRHYFETGALRWFDVKLGSLEGVGQALLNFVPEKGVVGLYYLALPTSNESTEEAKELCVEATIAAKERGQQVILGYPTQAWTIIDLSKELKALEKVRDESTEIQGDMVARREITSRLILLQNQLEAELQTAMMNAVWFKDGTHLENLSIKSLNNKASDVADALYYGSPKISNELLNRNKPSSNAIAAQNALTRAMVLNNGEERLGIVGYPAEGGLFESLLANTGLYCQGEQGYGFVKPSKEKDAARLLPAWEAAAELLEQDSERSVAMSEIYALWESEPYGVKKGLMPVLAVAFILSNREHLAFYREGIFQSSFTDLEVDYLSKDPDSIQLRWMDLTHVSKHLLSSLADLVRRLDPNNPLQELAPIDIGRGLVSVFDRLPEWTKRTSRLSALAIKARSVFKHASDPNQLLFNDLPSLHSENVDIQDPALAKAVTNTIDEALTELVEAYPKMLQRMAGLLLTELHVPSDSAQALKELNDRATNIKQMSGDFRVDAFIGRMTIFDGSDVAVEGLGSLAANKPPRDWVDADLDGAFIEIANLAQKFVRTESYAHVQGRKDKRKSLAVILSQEGRAKPLHYDFHIAESEQKEVDDLVSRLKQIATPESIKKEILLAALAELSGEYIGSEELGNE
ncbi:hypothetical protein SAMN05660443_0639 [Marinospirillum celere]|uniref:ATP-binding protein n=1 Tax=Marinospirillum celere TaxID=1122252 RepID=A0A1I1EQ77_9GAMM|nr:ATP-binding protein [Marinospirillum celere]SFB87070.1 hypothetical protein SAMN05660443_0639 [Marinospirillum celere]